MSRGFTSYLGLAAAFLLLAAGGAMADSLTLVNGGTVNGSFVYDQTTNSVLSFDFTTSAGGGFGNESFVGPVQGSAGAVTLSNQDGDEVFGFVAAQTNGDVDELDIVLACHGMLNCAEQATLGNSYAITSGPNSYPSASCPNFGTTSLTTGYCIASGLTNQVPDGFSADLLSANNYITISDPTCPATDSCLTFSLSKTPTGTVFGSNGGNGGGTRGVPEPGTLLLSVLAVAGIALKKMLTA